ncbi:MULTISPECIES: DUF397 domain-containing protein [unclassified Streptomyces]|uniref:DUF397 domain-containing protein n=1 Tax=unclassified Streptomyces TaxID=2593676 RepID=UPI002E1403BD|nr:DUF397 domain-containing protein [Streptomyces sp. NBC_01197]WSS51463.1 DUF397 domain-containing protein [Streptomyces sp. NBC_01180]
MRSLDLSITKWRKSSYSNSTGGDCIEVGDGCATVVPVRDSKNPDGQVLAFAVGGWASFVSAVKSGEIRA